MSEIRDKVEERIIQLIKDFGDCLHDRDRQDLVDAILAIPELAIVNRNERLSRQDFNRIVHSDSYTSFEEAQQRLVDKGWVKEVKDE